jgi:hypothetical protein
LSGDESHAADYLHARRVDRGLVMLDDPIVAEIHAFRKAWAKRFNYDLEALARDVQKRERAAQRKADKSPVGTATGGRPLHRKKMTASK